MTNDRSRHGQNCYWLVLSLLLVAKISHLGPKTRQIVTRIAEYFNYNQKI